MGLGTMNLFICRGQRVQKFNYGERGDVIEIMENKMFNIPSPPPPPHYANLWCNSSKHKSENEARKWWNILLNMSVRNLDIDFWDKILHGIWHLTVIDFSGKQRHIRLTPTAALGGDNTESVKMQETKGCTLFCTGLVRQGTSTVLCVAIKRVILVYELNRTKVRHRRVKEINVPGPVQYIEMINERLCVGYPSTFAMYSVQGEGAPMCKLAHAIL